MALIFETSVWLLAESTRLLFSSLERTKKVRCSWFLLPFWRCAPSLLFLPLLFLLEGERNLFFNNKRERNKQTTEAQPQESTERRRSKKHKKGTSSLLRCSFCSFGIHQQDSFPQTVLASLCCFFVLRKRKKVESLQQTLLLLFFL